MNKIKYNKNIFILFALILTFGLSSSAFGAATIVIANNDAAGVGFNDTTPATPVGGNPGTTIGQQRLNVFQAAANIWGATLTSSTTITIRAQWTALTCTATSAVLGSAGSIQIFRDYPNAPFAGTWYGGALANKLSGIDQNPAPNTNNEEINANFNVNLGQAGCLTGTFFYLGLDTNHGTNIDLETVLLHEFGHGLGFQTFTNGTTGAPNSGFPSVYDRFMLDNSTGKSWFNMTNSERVTSAINSRRLVWDGPRVQTDAPSALSLGTPLLQINTPAGIAGNYEVGTASFGPALTTGGITGNIVQALDPADTPGPSTTDGCSPLTNAAEVSGKIALIDRGTCGFTIKAANAQAAGAIAVIIADNAAGGPPAGLGGTDPSIIIPAVRITLADGNTIKAQLGSGVNGSLKLDNTIRAGADSFGKPQLYTPNPFASGSSVSHWDTAASPNMLMEPAINNDLTHQVTAPTDLTFSLLSDIGWVASNLPNSIAVSGGNNQSVLTNQTFPAPLKVTISPAVAGLIVTFTAPEGVTPGGTFANSGSLQEFNGDYTDLVVPNSRVATAVTDSSGVATAPVFTANGQIGSYNINATVPGAGTTSFQLNNLASQVFVSGRVFTSGGRALSNARVTVTRQSGATQIVTTSSFGYYNIPDLSAGETIVISVFAKGFQFDSQTVTLTNSLSDLNFTALP